MARGNGMARRQFTAMDDRERLIGLIYKSVTNEEGWEQPLAYLADELNAAGAGPELRDMASHNHSRPVVRLGDHTQRFRLPRTPGSSLGLVNIQRR